MHTLGVLTPGRQASLLVRYLTATTFREDALPCTEGVPDSYLRTEVVGPLEMGADRLLSGIHPPTPEGLRAATAFLAPLALDLRVAGAAAPVVSARVGTMSRRLEAALQGTPDNWVPEEIHAVFQSLLSVVRERYASSCLAHKIDDVRVELDFKEAEPQQNTDATGRLAVGGACRYVDSGRQTSIVRLVVRDGAFDWPSACVLPYVLAHELLCHAFQGIASDADGGARILADTSCAWSEGWMDRAALWIAEDWLRDATDIPSWMAEARTAIGAEWGRAHMDRCDLRAGPRLPQLRRRASARAAVDILFEECAKFGRDQARELVIRFSLSLNVARMTQACRNRVTDLIALGLEITGGKERDEVVSALLELPRTGDWQGMERCLQAAILPST